jgi:large subunit ribosomal protein L22
MRAFLKNYRQAPRKVRLVADLIRGKSVGRASTILAHTAKKSSEQMRKLLASAVANAKLEGVSDEKLLVVREIRVDQGITFQRIMPRARGRAAPIAKKTSHVTLMLAEVAPKAPKEKKQASAKREEAPKAATKPARKPKTTKRKTSTTQ